MKKFKNQSLFLLELGQTRSASANSSSSDPMEYKLIKPEHYDQVLEHLRCNFFADEPLNKAAGVCQNGCSSKELEDHCVEAMEDRMSLMTMEQGSCKIAGVVLNGILRADDTAKALEKLDSSCDPGFRKIFELLYRHNIKNDLFKRFDVDRCFDVRILSVDSGFRGRGIANELVKQSLAVAKKNGFRMLKADATGIFSQKIFRSHGFEVFAEQPYAKYTDDEGRIILPVEAPHIKLQLLYKPICEGDKEQKPAK